MLCSANFNPFLGRLARSAFPNTLLHETANIYNSSEHFFLNSCYRNGIVDSQKERKRQGERERETGGERKSERERERERESERERERRGERESALLHKTECLQQQSNEIVDS